MHRFALLLIVIGVLSSNATFAAAELPWASNFLKHIHAEKPIVRWDATSIITADFDGDGRPDLAVLGFEKGSVSVAIGRTSNHGKIDIQYLVFGIGNNTEDSVCQLPLHLYTSSLECTDNGQILPGCKENTDASALSLSDDACDSINMYWDHVGNRMTWWRN